MRAIDSLLCCGKRFNSEVLARVWHARSMHMLVRIAGGVAESEKQSEVIQIESSVTGMHVVA